MNEEDPIMESLSARGTHRRRGLARYALVALAGLAAGALGARALPVDHRRLDPVTTHGEWVRIPAPGGDSIRAYVAYPERNDPGPAVLIIHEIFGLSPWEPTVADELAGAGYVAVVPDLLSSRFGATPADPDSGRKLTALLVPDQVTADLDATYRYLAGLPAVRPGDIGVIGFCWGGTQTFRYATNNPDLKAAVVCYGATPDWEALPRIAAPVLGVYGENDARIDQTLPGTDSAMRRLGKDFKYRIYPGTGHGFLKPGRQGSDSKQVDEAWSHILDFYRDKLGR
jgi:carboxymethylenebutenolidase